MNKHWWKEAVCYQIYPKSFMDSNNDGIGDLRGIIEKLDYLKDLGVNVLWISPVYQSPMDDNGYDISDYYKIDPIFGNNEDMDELIEKADKRGIKIIMDLVVNHCSDEHQWFQKALAEPDSEEASYFYFLKPENGVVPNNWRSNFGGSVWEKTADGRFYLHSFSKKQPDLNWENPILREKIYEMINWWLDKGIAGFRVDAITFIKKDMTFASRPTEKGALYPIEKLINYPGIGDFLTELKEKTFKIYDCMTVGEAPGVEFEELPKYAGEEGYFSMIFDFTYDHLSTTDFDYSSKNYITLVNQWRERLIKSQQINEQVGWSPVFIENHDQPRCPNKFFRAEDINYYSTTMIATIYFMLRGTPFIYQGQELGMTNTNMTSIEDFKDVMAHTEYKEAIAQGKKAEEILKVLNRKGRDNARTPFQWEGSINAGFSKSEPWIKVNENYTEVNAKAQLYDERSVLAYYKKLVRLRRESVYCDTIVYGSFEPCYNDIDGVIAYLRKGTDSSIIVMSNYNSESCEVKIKENIKAVILSNYETQDIKDNQINLKPYESIIFEV